MSNLQRMIVIHPELFKKFKHIITEDQNLTDLDKKMKTILHNKNLNDINKWYQYRESLLKFSFLKKNKLNLLSPPKIFTMENSSQTNKIFQRSKEIQTAQAHASQNTSTQTNDDMLHTNAYSPTVNDKMEVFSNANNYNDGGLNNVVSNDDYDDDDEIRQMVLEDQPIGVKILKERKSTEPNADYRIFELNNGDNVTVPVLKKQILTRSSAAAAKLLLQSPKQMTQSAIPFKAVKKPRSGKMVKINSPTIIPSDTEKQSDFSWTKY